MVIKEMSSMGADVKAGNELDFREIFRDSRQYTQFTTNPILTSPGCHDHHHHHDYPHVHDHDHQGADGYKEAFVYPGRRKSRLRKNHPSTQDRCWLGREGRPRYNWFINHLHIEYMTIYWLYILPTRRIIWATLTWWCLSTVETFVVEPSKIMLQRHIHLSCRWCKWWWW